MARVMVGKNKEKVSFDFLFFFMAMSVVELDKNTYIWTFLK